MSRKQIALGWSVIVVLSFTALVGGAREKPVKGDAGALRSLSPEGRPGLPEGIPTIDIKSGTTAWDYLHSFDQQPMAAAVGDTPQDCPDIDGDDFVNLIDLAELAGNWLDTGVGLVGDFDRSEEVDVADLAIMGASWLTDPECDDYYGDTLPYLTSFEQYQGYQTDETPWTLDFQMGWQVTTGISDVWWNYAYVDDISGMDPFYTPYQLIHLGYDDGDSVATTIVKEFDDDGADHNYIRLHLLPSQNMEVKVMSDQDTIAAVQFNANGYIYVLHNGSYVNSGTSYAGDYNNGWWYWSNTNDYDNTWLDLKLKLNYSSDIYDVYWADDPNSIYTASFDDNYSTLSALQLKTTADDWAVVNRVSISDFASGDWDYNITQPCACADELELRGRIPVEGKMWAENLGAYDLYFCPSDVDIYDLDNWVKFESGAQVVDTDKLLGYWDTGVIPNGTYHVGVVTFNDLGFPEGLPNSWFSMIFKEVYIDTTKIYEGPGHFPVTGDLKANTFYHTEQPDFSIPWPGQFPFEVKRNYNNNRRFYNKPYRNGWTDNNQIILTEDARYYCETEDSGPFEVASWDENLLGIGIIWVTYPDGSRHMFRHDTGHVDYNPVIYRPYPDDGSEDYIERDSGGSWPYVDYVRYYLKNRDGEVWTFYTDYFYDYSDTKRDEIACPGTYGTVQWRTRVGIDSRTDRFGNTLNYNWDSDEIGVTEISYGSGTTARRIKFYDNDNDDRYDEARLVVGTDYNNPLRVIKYEWTPGDDPVYMVRHFNEGVDADGDWQTDPNSVSATTLYTYDVGRNLRGITYTEDPVGTGIYDDPAQILVEYDSWGRVDNREDYVETDNYLTTWYNYQFLLEDPEVPDVFNLKTIESTAYQSAILLQSPKGALLEHTTTANDGCAVKNSTYAYTDNDNPLKPTQIKEYFDGEEKRTYLTYSNYGNLLCQQIYDDANQPVYTDYTWHDEYDLPESQSSWQQPNRTGQKVQTVYVYGLANGTIDAQDEENNKYLIQEKVMLVEDPNYYTVTNYKYNANGLITEKVDPENHRTELEYDDYGYLKWVRIGLDGYEENVSRFRYDAIGQKLLEANVRGGVTLYDYDDNGRLYRMRTYEDPCALTIADGSFIVSRYTALSALTDVSYGYDRKGNRTWEKKTDIGSTVGGTVQASYTLNNLPDLQTLKQWDSGSSSYVTIATVDNDYDDRGLKTSEVRDDEISDLDWTIAYDYDGMGRQTEIIWYDYDDTTIERRQVRTYNGQDKVAEEMLYGYSLERHTTFDYDFFGRMTERVVDPANLALTTTLAYDSVGNRTKVVDPEGNWIYTAYDRANRPTTEYFAAVADTAIGSAIPRKVTVYNDDNTIFSVTDYDYDGTTVLACSEYDYDDRGRIKQVIQDIDGANDAVTDYDYSDTGFGAGNAYHVCITDAEDKDTWRALDAFGRLTKVLYPSGDYEEMTYYGDGSLWKKAVWDDQSQKDWIEYTYDGFGRLVETAYPDEGTVTNTYDGFGRKILVEDDRNATDNIGGSGAYESQLAYEYDPLNRLGCVTEQDGYQVRYAFRGDGQKHSITVNEPGDPNAIIYEVQYAYDEAGRLAAIYEPQLMLNGLVAEFDYDDNGNRDVMGCSLTGNFFGSTMDISYSYNLDNFLTGFSTTNGPTFSFDATTAGDIDGLGRLVSASETLTKTDSNTITHALDYSYDRLSRLTYAKTNNVPPMSYVEYTPGFDDVGNTLSMIFNDGTGDVTTNYSFTGDLVTGDGTNSVDWDDNGRQTSQLAGTPSNYYLDYDWNGRLRQAQAGGVNDYMTAKYTPDGARIAKERTWSDASDYDHKYIVDASGEFPVVLLVLDADNSNAILKTYIHANGQVILQHDGDMEDDRYFYLHDRLGSVRQVVDSSGDVVNCYTFDPWGLPIGNETAETVDNLYRFANYAWDDEPQMYHCYQREYDPVLFRFTSRDPVRGDFQEPMTLHAYLYCLDNSINNIDPTGESVLALDSMTAISYGAWIYQGAAFAGRAAMTYVGRVIATKVAQHIMVTAITILAFEYANDAVIDYMAAKKFRPPIPPAWGDPWNHESHYENLKNTPPDPNKDPRRWLKWLFGKFLELIDSLPKK